MNTKEDRYDKRWEKLSKRHRLLYHCFFCGEEDYEKKEAHHIDGDKKNSSENNILIVCKECHRKLHRGELEYNKEKHDDRKIIIPICENPRIWYDKEKPVQIIRNLDRDVANSFRRQHVKGFVIPGGCNYYIGAIHNDYLFGVLGFVKPDIGDYDIFLKADTTPTSFEYSIDLLLYILRTRETKDALEKKFNREINTAYSFCFSRYETINRYRRHGELITKKKIDGGYNLGYLFRLGTIASLKEAKSTWIQKNRL
jgi:hypothetical protein